VVSTAPLARSHFAIAGHTAYLNHATICAPPRPVIDAVTSFLDDAGQRGGLGFMDRVDSVRPVRDDLASLVGGREEGIAFAANTTTALTRIVDGLTWKPGDRVLIATHDFPSTRLPVLALGRRGVTVDEVVSDPVAGGVPLDAWAHALDAAPTRMVVTTWVHSNRGHRTDLADLAHICHQRRATLVADVIQGLGVIPCDVEAWGVDAVVGGSHKWLLAPEGVGFSWTSDELTDQIEVRADGWRWFGTDPTSSAYRRPPDDTALRFEGGTLNGPGLAGLGAGAAMLLTAGPDAIWDHVQSLGDQLVEGVDRLGGRVLSDRSPGARSAIVCFDHRSASAASLVEGIGERGVAVSERDDAVRVSPHGWNTADDVDALLDAAAELLA